MDYIIGAVISWFFYSCSIVACLANTFISIWRVIGFMRHMDAMSICAVSIE